MWCVRVVIKNYNHSVWLLVALRYRKTSTSSNSLPLEIWWNLILVSRSSDFLARGRVFQPIQLAIYLGRPVFYMEFQISWGRGKKKNSPLEICTSIAKNPKLKVAWGRGFTVVALLVWTHTPGTKDIVLVATSSTTRYSSTTSTS